MLLFFFFKQKTAYEMRISDWSSDVCSSDLALQALAVNGVGGRAGQPVPEVRWVALDVDQQQVRQQRRRQVERGDVRTPWRRAPGGTLGPVLQQGPEEPEPIRLRVERQGRPANLRPVEHVERPGCCSHCRPPYAAAPPRALPADAFMSATTP